MEAQQKKFAITESQVPTSHHKPKQVKIERGKVKSKKQVSNKEWKNQFSDRLFKFALLTIKIANLLPKTPAGFAIAAQLIKAGTSIGANYIEAQDASSIRDFIQKLSISLREAKESGYWLRIIKYSTMLEESILEDALSENGEIIAILITSIKSSKLKNNK